MIDIQTVACFNTRSPILHLFLPIQCQIHSIIERYEDGIRIADNIIVYGNDNEEYGR